jgi:hypothetical protein
MTEREVAPYAFMLPELPADRTSQGSGSGPVRVADAREAIKAYLEVGVVPWRFEMAVRSPANLAAPNEISFGNWANSALLADEPAGWGEFEDLAPDLWAALEEVPLDADLFRDWVTVREPVLDLFEAVLVSPSVSLVQASALLYQKRPALIPVLDRPMRSALGITGGRPFSREAVAGCFERIVAVGNTPENRKALDQLLWWIAVQPWETSYVMLSRARVVGIIARMSIVPARSPVQKYKRKMERRAARAAAEAAGTPLAAEDLTPRQQRRREKRALRAAASSDQPAEPSNG